MAVDLPVTKWMLPTEPYQGPDRCPACVGAKVTGTQYTFGAPGPNGRQTLVDVICEECDGCGRGSHSECQPADHAGGEYDDELGWDYEYDDNEPSELCPSCLGRKWWVATGFASEYMCQMRVPCGCSAPLMIEVSDG